MHVEGEPGFALLPQRVRSPCSLGMPERIGLRKCRDYNTAARGATQLGTLFQTIGKLSCCQNLQ